MGIFEHFPYVNMHNINMDWIIKRIKALEKYAADSKKLPDIIISIDFTSETVTCNKTFAEIYEMVMNEAIAYYRGLTTHGYTLTDNGNTATFYFNRILMADANSARLEVTKINIPRNGDNSYSIYTYNI